MSAGQDLLAPQAHLVGASDFEQKILQLQHRLLQAVPSLAWDKENVGQRASLPGDVYAAQPYSPANEWASLPDGVYRRPEALAEAVAAEPHRKPQRTSWLSALVADTPKKPASKGPKLVLHNQFLSHSPKQSSPAQRRDDTAQAPFAMSTDWNPAHDFEAALADGTSLAVSFAARCLTASVGGNNTVSLEDSRTPSHLTDLTPSFSQEPPAPPTRGSASRAFGSPHPVGWVEVEPDYTTHTRSAEPKPSPCRTPGSSGLWSSAAAQKWLSSSRGDFYCSSARAKVAAASIGHTPMPLDELLALPVPPMFLAADQQQKQRLGSASPEFRAEYSVQASPDGSHAYTLESSLVDWVEESSPPLFPQHRARAQSSEPPLPSPQRANTFRNDFADRPDTIWRGRYVMLWCVAECLSVFKYCEASTCSRQVATRCNTAAQVHCGMTS